MMNLLGYREFINTECSLIGSPILKVKAIKIDDNKKKQNLKQQLGCKNLKSCDYFRRKKDKFYFIELSDFHQQLIDLKKENNNEIASKIIKDEIRLKLSETLLLYYQLLRQCTVNDCNQKLKNKALLTVCKEKKSDVIVFAKLERDLSRYYCPTHLSSIKVIPYTELENIFQP